MNCTTQVANKSGLKICLWMLPVVVLFVAAIPVKAKDIAYLYTYHNKPPFIVDLPNRQGLYYDLAHLLTDKSEKYQFITDYIPRKRLDQFLEKKRLAGVVLGVSPVWFSDPNETEHLWLPSIFSDADEFVSLKTSPFEYQGVNSLTGRSLAAVSGYYYFDVNEAESAGIFSRLNTVGEREVLSLIEKGRADVGIVSQSVFRYLIRHEGLQNIYHFSANKHDKFERRAFTTKNNKALHEEMILLFEKMHSDGSWHNLVSSYR